jgi:hypothetical protein
VPPPAMAVATLGTSDRPGRWSVGSSTSPECGRAMAAKHAPNRRNVPASPPGRVRLNRAGTIVRAASALMTRPQRHAASRLGPGPGGGSALDRRARPLSPAAGVGAQGAWAPDHPHDQAALGLGSADEGCRRRWAARPCPRGAHGPPSRAAADAAAGSGGTGALAHRRRVGTGDQLARLPAGLRTSLRQLAAGVSNGVAGQVVSFVLRVPADDVKPIEVRRLSEGVAVYAQARELLGDLVEVVRARLGSVPPPQRSQCLLSVRSASSACSHCRHTGAKPALAPSATVDYFPGGKSVGRCCTASGIRPFAGDKPR